MKLPLCGSEVELFGARWRVKRVTRDKLILGRAANELTRWREANGLTQREAAAALGVSQSKVAKIELGDLYCPPEILAKITR